MSHWSKLTTKLKDKEVLMRTLKELYPKHIIEENVNCRGYGGAQEKCAVVVKDPNGTHDLGFRMTKDGTYEQIIDWYQVSWTSKKYLDDNLDQKYAVTGLKKAADEMSAYYQEIMGDNGDITLEVDVL